jgi:hyaluronan synthase
MILSLGVRQTVHLKRRTNDIVLLPVWVLFMTFIMIPIRLIGFFTMGRQEWMTR